MSETVKVPVSCIRCVLCVLLLMCLFPNAMHGQERRRPSNPTLATTMLTARSALYGPSQPVGTDRYLYFFISSNYKVSDPAINDELRGDVTPLAVWRVRTVESTSPGGSPRTFFCRVMTLWVQARAGEQRVRIEPAKLIVPIKEGDRIAVEHRPWRSISTSIDDAGVTCDACAWRDEKLAPVRGFAVPNGSCQ